MAKPQPAKLKKTSQLPFDLLVVGASAAGSSAAFVAAHAGLKVAVYSDCEIMAEPQLLDPKSKPASHKAWPFGEAGELLRELSGNNDPEAWRCGYAQFNLTLSKGQSLAQLSRIQDGRFHAVFQNAEGAASVIETRQVLLTSASTSTAQNMMDLDGVAQTLEAFAPGPTQPICIIGGGADALNVISELAHIYHGQPLVWCDAAPSFPPIPDDLREEMLHLCVETRMLRYFPNAQLVGLQQTRRGQIVSIRLDDATQEDLMFARHLEMPLSQCLVLNERGFPREILRELGARIEIRQHRTMAVIDDGYAALPGLYLAGSLLSPCYLQRDYNGQEREIPHGNSLGQAVIEGMTVAHQVIQQLAGQANQVSSAPEPLLEPKVVKAKPSVKPSLGAIANGLNLSGAPPKTSVSTSLSAGPSSIKTSIPKSTESGTPAQMPVVKSVSDASTVIASDESAHETGLERVAKKLRVSLSGDGHKAAFAAAAEARPLLAPDALRLEKKLRLERTGVAASNAPAILAAIAARNQVTKGEVVELDGILARLGSDGAPIETVALHHQVLVVGKQGESPFSADASLEGIRAKILRRTEGYILRDEGSASGLFLKLDPQRPRVVQKGDLLRLGDQFLVCDSDEAGPLLRHYDSRGNAGRSYRVSESPLLLGRGGKDILAADDTLLAQRHIAAWLEADQVYVRDLGSAHGSFLRLIREFPMRHGDCFQFGHELIQFINPNRESAKEPLPEPVFQEDARVTIVGMGGPYVAPGGTRLCALADLHGLKLNAECRVGACGLDAVRIISGKENVDPFIDDLERDTLVRICGLKPGTHRLACKLRVSGPVRLRLIPPTQ